MKIAITGKGGSGKTMLASVMTGLLAGRGGRKILAIDADSAVNLPYALGVEVKKTVSDIRRLIIEEPGEKAKMEEKSIITVMEEALHDAEGFRLLVMGRPEGPGCYCSVNDLLRYGIERLSTRFDVTIVDCEAGPEQLNRRVLRGVDVLVILSDAAQRGIRVAGSIAEVISRDETIRPARAGLVINRVKPGNDNGRAKESAAAWGLEIFGTIPEDETISAYDRDGRPLVDLPGGSPAVSAIRDIVRAIGM
ncbi:MAG: AAA family ATPase [Pseudomonadota bacterium]